MKERKKSILVYAAILLIFVAASFIALSIRLNTYLQDASGAIDLNNGPIISEKDNSTNNNPDSEAGEKVIPSTQNSNTQDSAGSAVNVAQKKPFNPGFETSDDNQTWTSNTKIDIFKISYVNGEGEVTVESSNGDKVFAPGTENSYTFKLKNTGDVSLEYEMQINAYFTPEDIVLPIDLRINRYDGKWLTEDDGTYVNASSVGTVSDKDVLGASRYTYYTIDWIWPFETGNDQEDTNIGNLASGDGFTSGQDLSLTIEINTVATATEEPGGGFRVPDTGDNTNTILWISILFGSTLLLILLIYYKRNTEDKEK